MIPVKLKMNNFFSHKDSEVDFSNFDSALLIGNTEGDYSKSNGSGKSAIFESILWCLFNKSRASMMDDIIRWGETTCFVELEFKHDGKTYRVKRLRNRMSSTSSVEFSYLDKAGEWSDISCSTSGDTNSKIESIIKLDYKTFVNSIYFRQNDISEFAEAEPSKKKEILKSIVDISRWDEYEKGAKKIAKEISLECKVLRKSVEDYDEVVERLEGVRVDIASAGERSKILLSKKSSLSKQIDNLSAKYASIKKSLDTDTYDRAVEKIASLGEKKAAVVARIKEEGLSVDKYNGELSSLTKKISEMKAAASEVVADESLDGRIEDLRAQLAHYKGQKASSEELLKKITEIELSKDHCYVCSQEISEGLYESLVASNLSTEAEYRKNLSESNREILEIQSDLNSAISLKKDAEKYAIYKSKLDAEEYKLDLVKDSLKKHVESSRALQLSLDQVDFELNSNAELLESIKNEDFQTIGKNLKSLKGSLKDIVEKISEEDKNMGRLLERESLLSERESKMRSDKESVAKKMQRAALFDKLSKMYGKNGIQAILLDTVIEDLEKTSNVILASICNEPSVIVLETQRVGADGSSVIETLDLKVRKDGHLQNFKSLSGGEKFRISLALRIALSDMSSRYGGGSLEFLLLDEVNSPLDRYGVETLFVNVIRSLEDKYKILVITHDESLKEKFDNVINITKVNGESELEFLTR